MENTNPTPRQLLEQQIREKRQLRDKLRQDIDDLSKEWYLLNDDQRWFEEKVEQITVRENRKKVVQEHLIGKTCWNEDFKDEDTGEIVTITRRMVIRVNGEWKF